MPSGSRPRTCSHVRAPSPLAVAITHQPITVTTTALDRVSGVVCGGACVPGFGCGLARMCLWVGLVLRLVCEVHLCLSRAGPDRAPDWSGSRVCPVLLSAVEI